VQYLYCKDAEPDLYHININYWVKGLEFPVLFHQQIFTNKDDSTGTLYLISNELTATKTM